jgi:hypothetical protein
MAQFVQVQEKDLGAGIDRLSAESSVQEGFSQKLVNWEPTPEGYLSKREGYTVFGGRLPLRVHSLQSSNTKLIFNPEVSLANLANVPILIGGWDATGTTWSTQYTSSYSIDPRIELTGTTPVSFSSQQTGLTSPNSSIQLWEKQDSDALAEYIGVDELKVSESNYLLTITPNENVTGNVKAFAVYKGRGVAGESAVVMKTAFSTTVSLTAAEHGLNTTSLQVDIFQDTGTDRVQVWPDTLVISPTGITATFSQILGTDVYFLISKTYAEQAFTISSGATTTTSLFSIDTSYPLMQAWFLASDGSREQGLIDSIQVNQQTQEAQVTVQNNSPSAVGLIITWEAGQVVDNVLSLTSGNVDAQQVGTLVWGINQNECWDSSNSTNRAGWSNYLDSYRAEAQEYLVTGSDRELFIPDSDNSITPTTGLSVRARKLLSGSNQLLGPRFIGLLEDTPTYTTSFFARSAGGETGWLRSSTSEWQSGNTVRFTVSVDSLTGSVSNFIGQFLTIRKAGFSKLEGVFEIMAASYSSGVLQLSVVNSLISNADFDGATCLLGVFSGTVSVTDAPSVFLVGDEVNNTLTVKKVSANSLVLDGFSEAKEFIAGTPLIVSDRAALNVIPLRLSNGTETEALGITSSILVGDSLFIGSESAQFETIDLIPSNTFLTSSAPTAIRVGQKVLVTGDTSGVMTVKTNSGGVLTFEEMENPTGTYWVVGNSVVLDRPYAATDLVVGGFNVVIQPRWEPIPRTIKTQLPFSEDSQFPVSSMASDSLYIVASELTSAPLKWDGSLLTRSGIPRYPIHAFISKDISSGAIPLKFDQTLSTSAVDGNKMTIVATEKDKLPVGTEVVIGTGTAIFTIIGYETAAVILDRTATGSGVQTLKPVFNINYYYRIKAVDSNNYSTVSAPYGFAESKVVIHTNTTICHKVVIPPSFEFVESSRYQLEVFRTKQGTQAPYYLVKTLPFSSANKYLYFEDSKADGLLTELDSISSVLAGGEVITGLEEMPQGKSFTTSGNRSVVANIRSKPEINLQLISKSTSSSPSVANWNGVTFTVGGRTFEFVTVSPLGLSGTTVAYSSGTWTINTTSSHGLTTGNWVYIGGDSNEKDQNQLVGWFQVTVVDSDTFSIYQLVESAELTIANQYLSVYLAGTAGNVPVLLGTDKAQNDSAFSDFEAVRRLALAIRSTTSLIAEAGDGLAGGVLILRSESGFNLTYAPTGSFTSNIQVLQNGSSTNSTTLSSTRTLFPSRLVVSYRNRPEMFDSCFTPDDADSDSAIDINPSDGQEITGVQPFFGESSFGQSSKEGVLIVTKTNSVYLVDLTAKANGQNAVQKLDTQGLGCEYPRTMAPTRFGVQFANRAGVWKITQDLRLTYAGRRLQNLWSQELFPLIEANDIPCSHNFRQESKWRLILNLDTGVSYNHLREYLPDGYRDGSWAELDNYPGLVFCNLAENAFMASSNGRVLLLTGGVLSDSGTAIQAEAILAAKDFGDSSRRKLVQNFILQVKSNSLPVSLQVQTNIDLSSQFEDADALVIPQPSLDGLSSGAQYPILPYAFSPNSKRGTYFQVRIVDANTDSDTDILGISYKVAGLSDKGIKDAKS